jgi:hypothetical protein
MNGQRVTGIRVPLTPEQRKKFEAATGHEVTEVVVVGETSSMDRLDNEVASQLDQAIVRAVWDKQATFSKLVEGAPYAREARAPGKRTEDPQPPPTLFFAH